MHSIIFFSKCCSNPFSGGVRGVEVVMVWLDAVSADASGRGERDAAQKRRQRSGQLHGNCLLLDLLA